MTDDTSFGWLRDPRGFLKVIILITDLLSLAFFVEGVGFLKTPEFRLYFIVTGGFLLVLLYRLITYTFEGRLTSGPQEIVADLVGALLLISLAILLVFRGLNETNVLRAPTTNYTMSLSQTPMPLQTTVTPNEFTMNWILIFVSAGCGIVAGIILTIDAIIVMAKPTQ